MYAERDGIYVVFRDSSGGFVERLDRSTAWDVIRGNLAIARHELDVAQSKVQRYEDRLAALEMVGLG